MKSSDVPNVDIFPHEIPDISWNLANYVLHHPPQKKIFFQNLSLSQCNSKIIKILKSYTWETKRNGEVDDFLVLTLKTKSGWYLQSKPWNSPKERRWACLQNLISAHLWNCSILYPHNQHVAPDPSQRQWHWRCTSPLTRPKSELEQLPTFSLKIRLFVWVIYCMCIAGENRFFFFFCFFPGFKIFTFFHSFKAAKALYIWGISLDQILFTDICGRKRKKRKKKVLN